MHLFLLSLFSWFYSCVYKIANHHLRNPAFYYLNTQNIRVCVCVCFGTEPFDVIWTEYKQRFHNAYRQWQQKRHEKYFSQFAIIFCLFSFSLSLFLVDYFLFSLSFPLPLLHHLHSFPLEFHFISFPNNIPMIRMKIYILIAIL